MTATPTLASHFIDDDPPNEAPYVYIQWKGTEACLDFYCACGSHSHVDAAFAYNVRCPACSRVYELACFIAARETTEDNGNVVDAFDHWARR